MSFSEFAQLVTTVTLPIAKILSVKNARAWVSIRVSIQGVKSLGGHIACLCRGFAFYEVKKNKKNIFQEENGNTVTLLIIVLEKSLQKEQIAQITQYDS